MKPRRTVEPTALGDAADIVRLIEADAWMIEVLACIRDHGPPRAWAAAGFVRNKVWDAQHGWATPTLLSDVDVIYFNAENLDPEADAAWEAKLQSLMPLVPWEVRNQARMHLTTGQTPALGTLDAMRRWPETVTAVAARLDGAGGVRFVTCYGVPDLLCLTVRPTPGFPHDVYATRMAKKNWKETWPKLAVRDV